VSGELLADPPLALADGRTATLVRNARPGERSVPCVVSAPMRRPHLYAKPRGCPARRPTGN
jgi:hypothetical protein